MNEESMSELSGRAEFSFNIIISSMPLLNIGVSCGLWMKKIGYRA
jgi:hypothetical protein